MMVIASISCGKISSEPPPAARSATKESVNPAVATVGSGARAVGGWLHVGNFEISSGRVVITDPGYTDDVKTFRGKVAAKTGPWVATIRMSDEKEMGERVAELLVFHQATTASSLQWQDAGFRIGVDSGTAGVFDEIHYRDDGLLPPKSNLEPGQAWYERFVVDEVWKAKPPAIIVPSGFISASGFGDGGYTCELARGPSGEVEGIRIIFIAEGADGADARQRMKQVIERGRKQGLTL